MSAVGDAGAARIPSAARADPLAVGRDRDLRGAVRRGGADPGDDRAVAESPCRRWPGRRGLRAAAGARTRLRLGCASFARDLIAFPFLVRSEEHTSELQSLLRISYAVLCLKKKPSEGQQGPHRSYYIKRMQAASTQINANASTIKNDIQRHDHKLIPHDKTTTTSEQKH